jgi:cell division protein FtsL
MPCPKCKAPVTVPILESELSQPLTPERATSNPVPAKNGRMLFVVAAVAVVLVIGVTVTVLAINKSARTAAIAAETKAAEAKVAEEAETKRKADLQRETGDILRRISVLEAAYKEAHKNFSNLDNMTPIELKNPSISSVVTEYKAAVGVLQSLRGEIYRHSDYERPTVDQIRHDEVDHASMREQVEAIAAQTKSYVNEKLKKQE